MSLSLLAILLAVVILVGFAASRVLRVRSGREARLYGTWFAVLLAAVLIVPPVLFVILAGPTAPRAESPVVGAILSYFITLFGLAALMGIAAALVRRFVFGNARATLLLFLVGREPSAADVPVDPPMTDEIRAGVALVDQRNAVFPRGQAFMGQADLPGFAASWAELDDATTRLERLISDANGLGTGVSIKAVETANDARSRLNALRGSIGRGAVAGISSI